MIRTSNIFAKAAGLILASLLLASCVKSQTIQDGEPQEIALKTVGSAMLKAPADYTGGPFGVISYISETASGTNWTGSATQYFAGKFVDKGSDIWGGDPPRYWPLGNKYSLIFAGFSPYVKADGSTEVAATFDYAAKTLSFVDYEVESSGGLQSDLMFFMPKTDATGNYFVGTNQNDDAAMSVMFRHALSQVVFNITVKSGDEDLVEVGNVVLNDVVFRGTCTVTSGNIVTWSRSGEDVYKRNETIASDDPVMIIPGTSYPMDLSYDLKLNGKTFTETVRLDVDEIEYASGYRYTYDIVIGASAITIDTDFSPWTDR